MEKNEIEVESMMRRSFIHFSLLLGRLFGEMNFYSSLFLFLYGDS